MVLTRAMQTELPFTLTSFFQVVQEVIEARAAQPAKHVVSTERVLTAFPARARTWPTPQQAAQKPETTSNLARR
jgi:hypothetical protein